MSIVNFSAQDIAELTARGISEEEARRQISLIAHPPALMHLNRPCTVGDGIRLLSDDELPELLGLHAAAAAAGRFTKFVPASGAATRMFRELLACRADAGQADFAQHRAWAGEDKKDSKALVRFMEALERFAFFDDLDTVIRRDPACHAGTTQKLLASGDYCAILDALLGDQGLQYAQLPKGLLKFHRYRDCCRTPFEEHLIEAAQIIKDAQGTARLHLTISPEHRQRFTALFENVRRDLEREYAVHFDISFSVQKPSTDTVALDTERRLFRNKSGSILFRPGGHGALIENLNDLEGDLIYIKNIDNVQPDSRKQLGIHWKRLLGGYLVKLQQETFKLIGELDDPAAGDADQAQLIGRAVEYLRERLHITIPDSIWSGLASVEEQRLLLLAKLNRPMRVCGVVRNTGEPGGGPFWVRSAEGSLSLQIVEGAQIDRKSPAQEKIFNSSTHFNPVDIVCGVRDFQGDAFDLLRYTDPLAVMLSKKSHAGQNLLALERPGLWNGAMSNWITIFVEIPAETFTPVKTVLDLLRPEHQ